MRNETVILIVHLRFYLMSTVMLQRSTFTNVKFAFLTQTFLTSFRRIKSSATIFPPLCSSHQDGSNNIQFDFKLSGSKFDQRSEVRSGRSGHAANNSIRSKGTNILVPCYSSIKSCSKGLGKKRILPYTLQWERSKDDLT